MFSLKYISFFVRHIHIHLKMLKYCILMARHNLSNIPRDPQNKSYADEPDNNQT